jgi:phosphatidylglycerol:prolipoprotein diacylglycerol transferase
MLQEIFRIPWINLPVYSYGVMLVVAYLACVTVAKAMARRKGIDTEYIVNMAVIAMVTGVIGSRLSHVLENWSTYTNPERSVLDNLLDAINIRAGGLTFYGGFLLATPCCIGYTIAKHVPIRTMLDLVAPIVMIGLGFGRIGCYLNGCCYGELCRPAFGAALTTFPYDSNPYIDQFYKGQIHPPEELIDILPGGGQVLKNWDEVRKDNLVDLADQQKSLPVQPTQLYSSFTAFLLVGLLLAYWTLPHVEGRVFALMLILEGPARFMLEMIRVEPPVITGHIGSFDVNMSLSMVLGLAVFLVGIVLWVGLGFGKRSENQGFFAPPVEKQSISS